MKPAMNTFESREDFAQFVGNAVPLLGEALEGTPALTATIAAPFEVAEVNDDPVPGGARGLVIKRLRWVIQGDDLAALKALSDGVKAAAGAGFFAHTTALAAGPFSAAVVGVVFATFALVRQARKKGARLSAEEMAVLSVLAAAERSLTAPQITRALLQASADQEWTVSRTSEQLAVLQRKRLSDGSVKAFCAEDAAGGWSAVDPGLVI
jgi:hypothetical protein